MPGVNHLPMATEAPGFERNFLKGLSERPRPCSSFEYHAFQSAPTWMNQLLQNELVATLCLSVGSASCAEADRERPAKANAINNFFITFISLIIKNIVLNNSRREPLLPYFNAKLTIKIKSCYFLSKICTLSAKKKQNCHNQAINKALCDNKLRIISQN